MSGTSLHELDLVTYRDITKAAMFNRNE